MVSLRRRGERSLENKWGQAPFILQKQRVLEPYSRSLPLILKDKVHSAIDGKAGRSVSFDHLVFFIKNVIQAAENLEA